MKANYNRKMSKKARDKLEKVCAEKFAKLFPIPPTQYTTSITKKQK